VKASTNVLIAHLLLVVVVEPKEMQTQKEEASTAEPIVVLTMLRIPQAQTIHIPHHPRAPLDKIIQLLHQDRITDHHRSQDTTPNHLLSTMLLLDPNRHQIMLHHLHHRHHPNLNLNPNTMLLLDTPHRHPLRPLNKKHRSQTLHPKRNPLRHQLPPQSPKQDLHLMLQQVGKRLEKKPARERKLERRQRN
jgi:hypothetical protein